MTQALASGEHAVVSREKPLLLFFYSETSGRCRRAEGFLAQVLQRRRNHETFRILRVSRESRADIVQRFEIETLPTLLVVDEKVVRAKLVEPRGCEDIQELLAPWLR